jgi:rhodanese-related sulfurtransferase
VTPGLTRRFRLLCSRRLAATLVACAVLASSGAAAADEPDAPAQSPIPRVDRQLLLGFLADNSTLALIDARSPEEFVAQHLPGAINVPFDAVAEHEALLPEDPAMPIVVYCRTGKRAGLLQAALRERGYANVQVLPREQIFWEEDFMVFNCGTEPAASAAQSGTRARQPQQ